MNATAFGPAQRVAADLHALAERLRRIVVEVRSGEAGSGTGIIWGASGFVLTNAHCIAERLPLHIEVGGGRLPSRAVAYDRAHDLALVSAPSGSSAPVEIREPESLVPGELLFALGHPLGIRDALTMGVLQGVAADRDTGAPRWIVADVRLAPGNSGGPLVDSEGRLVGINSMIVNGVGVAVPASIARRFVAHVLARRAA